MASEGWSDVDLELTSSDSATLNFSLPATPEQLRSTSLLLLHSVHNPHHSSNQQFELFPSTPARNNDDEAADPVSHQQQRPDTLTTSHSTIMLSAVEAGFGNSANLWPLEESADAPLREDDDLERGDQEDEEEEEDENLNRSSWSVSSHRTTTSATTAAADDADGADDDGNVTMHKDTSETDLLLQDAELGGQPMTSAATAAAVGADQDEVVDDHGHDDDDDDQNWGLKQQSGTARHPIIARSLLDQSITEPGEAVEWDEERATRRNSRLILASPNAHRTDARSLDDSTASVELAESVLPSPSVDDVFHQLLAQHREMHPTDRLQSVPTAMIIHEFTSTAKLPSEAVSSLISCLDPTHTGRVSEHSFLTGVNEFMELLTREDQKEAEDLHLYDQENMAAVSSPLYEPLHDDDHHDDTTNPDAAIEAAALPPPATPATGRTQLIQMTPASSRVHATPQGAAQGAHGGVSNNNTPHAHPWGSSSAMATPARVNLLARADEPTHYLSPTVMANPMSPTREALSQHWQPNVSHSQLRKQQLEEQENDRRDAHVDQLQADKQKLTQEVEKLGKELVAARNVIEECLKVKQEFHTAEHERVQLLQRNSALKDSEKQLRHTLDQERTAAMKHQNKVNDLSEEVQVLKDQLAQAHEAVEKSQTAHASDLQERERLLQAHAREVKDLQAKTAELQDSLSQAKTDLDEYAASFRKLEQEKDDLLQQLREMAPPPSLDQEVSQSGLPSIETEQRILALEQQLRSAQDGIREHEAKQLDERTQHAALVRRIEGQLATAQAETVDLDQDLQAARATIRELESAKLLSDQRQSELHRLTAELQARDALVQQHQSRAEDQTGLVERLHRAQTTIDELQAGKSAADAREVELQRVSTELHRLESEALQHQQQSNQWTAEIAQLQTQLGQTQHQRDELQIERDSLQARAAAAAAAAAAIPSSNPLPSGAHHQHEAETHQLRAELNAALALAEQRAGELVLVKLQAEDASQKAEGLAQDLLFARDNNRQLKLTLEEEQRGQHQQMDDNLQRVAHLKADVEMLLQSHEHTTKSLTQAALSLHAKQQELRDAVQAQPHPAHASPSAPASACSRFIGLLGSVLRLGLLLAFLVVILLVVADGAQRRCDLHSWAERLTNPAIADWLDQALPRLVRQVYHSRPS
ncbi:hypothetical protein CAOG_06531 [Capsaspora owczarzaki ATCC 30864]|uniref:EF-hand domain-containing protein n=1 Tax=Capsaspora owczarzaki (strain ATCC 30864) TaxID=595528 RepID=A0A0D2WU90_CAPO3|nr:hypothetical protein CAOG_06531 [Capsaspora owczarzaki ATCC 30864]KJE96170.1 hypothetical protein CAOG_006531 [Capsaspora owczarzaki ATCC 30864]|eukprot:XP_004345280.1 hypothetical protein CAOG_06531 [Capsaspora owczarzaki ATCC 30864]